MPKYKDRGIVKWLPFDALSSHKDYIDQMIYMMNKKDKPELSLEKQEELNEKLELILKEDLTVEIEYYLDGYFYKTIGKIKKVDYNQRIIILDVGDILNSFDIININIVR